jgi:hypothetical protein
MMMNEPQWLESTRLLVDMWKRSKYSVATPMPVAVWHAIRLYEHVSELRAHLREIWNLHCNGGILSAAEALRTLDATAAILERDELPSVERDAQP